MRVNSQATALPQTTNTLLGRRRSRVGRNKTVGSGEPETNRFVLFTMRSCLPMRDGWRHQTWPPIARSQFLHRVTSRAFPALHHLHRPRPIGQGERAVSRHIPLVSKRERVVSRRFSSCTCLDQLCSENGPFHRLYQSVRVVPGNSRYISRILQYGRFSTVSYAYSRKIP